MRRFTLALASLFVVVGLALAVPQASKKSSAKETIRCSLTGKKMDTCCCEKKDGKLYCTLAKKTIEKCCCEADGAAKAKSKKS